MNDYSDYSPPVWADVVLEAKGDDHDKVVVMTVAPDQSALDPLCPGIPQEEPSRPHQFSMLFEHGLQGSVCAPEYGPYFDEAASLAAELCDAGPQG